MGYNGKNIWIVGASSGIGYALAHELAARGARLALSARREEALETLKEGLGESHLAIPFDAADEIAFAQAAERVRSAFGRIDAIIALSGIYEPSSLAEMKIESAKRVIDINLGSMLNALYATLPLLRAQGGGQLALCGSVAGYRGLPFAQPYGATKAAVINLAETARLEESRNNIDIRVINPGFVRTPMTDKNSFPMPMMVSAEQAAQDIADGLLSSSFEIHFPKKFTFLMKLLKILPDKIYFRLLRR